MKKRVLVLGAGFGGLELSTLLSDAFGDDLELTLIDQNDSFVFGYSKLDVMFGRSMLNAVRLPYSSVQKPGVIFLQEEIKTIDPVNRCVITDRGTHSAEVMVVALGANYDPAATPGLVEGGYEFYSVGGAERLRDVLPTFTGGQVVVGVTSTPFKCPPAPSETVLLLHDYLTGRGIRDRCEISLVMPFGTPVPPSPGTSQALLKAFVERDIHFIPNRLVRKLDLERKKVVLDHGEELPYELFLGIPKHRVPRVVAESGMAVDGWIPVNPKTLETRFPGVYAVGDVTSVGTPKAGVFSEGAAQVVAASLIARQNGSEPPPAYTGRGSCYVEFGEDRIARVDVDFLSGPAPTGSFQEPSVELKSEKKLFGTSRKARWFGLDLP
jgi:sulfide:quinone oxidoreductase